MSITKRPPAKILSDVQSAAAEARSAVQSAKVKGREARTAIEITANMVKRSKAVIAESRRWLRSNEVLERLKKKR